MTDTSVHYLPVASEPATASVRDLRLVRDLVNTFETDLDWHGKGGPGAAAHPEHGAEADASGPGQPGDGAEAEASGPGQREDGAEAEASRPERKDARGPDEAAVAVAEGESLEAWLARHPGASTLPDPPALERWLRERGFAVHRHLNEQDLRSVIRFREALRLLLLANNDAEPEPDPEAVGVLREVAERVRMRVAVGEGGAASLEPAGDGVEALFAAVLAAIAAGQADGTWERLKACRAEDCRYAFFDESKNRSRAWCSMKVCGNRAKTRAYRARKSGPKPI